MGTYLRRRTKPSSYNLYLALVKYALKFLVTAAFFTYTVGGIATVLLNVDPLGRYISRTPYFPFPPLVSFCIRIILMLLLCSELYRVLMTYFLIAIILLVTLNITLQNLIKYINETPLQKSRIRVSRLILFMKATDAFRATEIYFKKNEPAYAASIPIIIYSGSALIVISNYCTIKLFGIVLPPEYFMFPIFSIFVVICLLTVLPEATKIHERSVQFHWNGMWQDLPNLNMGIVLLNL